MPYADPALRGVQEADEAAFAALTARVAALETGAVTSKGKIDIPILSGIVLATGVGVSAAAPSSATPGTAIADSKSAVVKWLANAAPAAYAINVPVPADLDDSQPVVFHAHLSKSGATANDTAGLTVAAFEIVPGAVHDADSDFGGDTTLVVGDATAKTVTEVTLTFSADNIHAYAEAICLQIKAKAGKLGTDNLYQHDAWLEYTKKVLTS